MRSAEPFATPCAVGTRMVNGTGGTRSPLPHTQAYSPWGLASQGSPRWPTYRAPLPRARKGLTKPGPIHISALRCVTPLLPIPRGHLACPGAGPVAGVPWQVPWKLKRDQEGQQRLSNFGESSGSPGDPELGGRPGADEYVGLECPFSVPPQAGPASPP